MFCFTRMANIQLETDKTIETKNGFLRSKHRLVKSDHPTIYDAVSCKKQTLYNCMHGIVEIYNIYAFWRKLSQSKKQT